MIAYCPAFKIIRPARVITTLLIALSLSAPMSTLAESDQLSTGIKVHGDWEITVSEPDGTVVHSLEFRNEFEGQYTLWRLFTGQQIISRNTNGNFWGITFNVNPFQRSDECEDYIYDDLNDTRILEHPGNTIHLERIVQLGSECVAVQNLGDFEITEVGTRLRTEHRGGTLAQNYGFTRKLLDSPIPATAGQTITFKVAISFE